MFVWLVMKPNPQGGALMMIAIVIDLVSCHRFPFVSLFASHVIRFAFVEFTNPESVPIALQYNGALFGDRPIK